MQRTPNLGLTSLFNHVSCASTHACVAVGSRQPAFSTVESTVAEGWNGSRWAIEPTDHLGSGGSELNGVSCTSRRACTAVGSFTNSAFGNPATLVERYS